VKADHAVMISDSLAFGQIPAKLQGYRHRASVAWAQGLFIFQLIHRHRITLLGDRGNRLQETCLRTLCLVPMHQHCTTPTI